MSDQAPSDPLYRRAWRLAYLLTGSPAAAAEVLARVERAPSELPADDPARLDRLVIMHTREVVAAPRRRRPAEPTPRPASHDDAALCAAASLELPQQPREAWILARLDELDGIRVSRAMDCSRTAAERHLAAADERMRAALGDRLDAGIAALRERVDAIDPGPAVAAHRALMRRRSRQRLAVGAGLALIVLLGGAMIVLTVLS